MLSEWLRAILLSLAAGAVWSGWREMSRNRRIEALEENIDHKEDDKSRRLLVQTLLGMAVCLAGLILLSLLGLSNLPPL